MLRIIMAESSQYILVGVGVGANVQNNKQMCHISARWEKKVIEKNVYTTINFKSHREAFEWI